MVENTVHTKEEVLDWLEHICDPEIPVVSIREMGMLRDIHIHEDGVVEALLSPTYTACPAMHMIEQDIMATLTQKGIKNPKVTMVYSPAWNTDDMSEATKEKLRDYGIAPPVHSSCANWLMPANVTICCPKCNSADTKMVSRFGATACKALYQCNSCKEPFEYFKCH